jgi:hypothetical protein
MNPVCDRFATQVHVRVGLDEVKPPSFVADFGFVGKARGCKLRVVNIGQAVEREEAGVVARYFILRTDVAETGNEVFHLISNQKSKIKNSRR